MSSGQMETHHYKYRKNMAVCYVNNICAFPRWWPLTGSGDNIFLISQLLIATFYQYITNWLTTFHYLLKLDCIKKLHRQSNRYVFLE